MAGTGYVGLSLFVLLAQHHQVTAVDIIQEKVDMINNRKSPIYSFNNIYAPTPFECINRHFAKMAYEHGRGLTV